MKAFFNEKTLVIVSKHELELLKSGAQQQAKYACDMRDSSNYPEIRASWDNAYNEFKELVSDIDDILNSMPF